MHNFQNTDELRILAIAVIDELSKFFSAISSWIQYTSAAIDPAISTVTLHIQS